MHHKITPNTNFFIDSRKKITYYNYFNINVSKAEV